MREYRDVSVGPDGEIALFTHSLSYPNPNHYHFTLLRTNTLIPVAQADGKNVMLSFSGDRLIFSNSNIVWMRVADNNSVVIYQAPRTICWPPIFVSPDAYIITENTGRQCDSFELVTKGGKSLLDQRFNGEEFSNLTSRVDRASHGQGSAFAISSESRRSGHFDTSPTITRQRIRVYDLASRRLFATLDVSPLPKAFFAFTVSHDGRLLAVLTDTTLRVYGLPSLQPH
jgi:hypothetical protein